jgi:hypothetical protein
VVCLVFFVGFYLSLSPLQVVVDVFPSFHSFSLFCWLVSSLRKPQKYQRVVEATHRARMHMKTEGVKKETVIGAS